MEDMSGDVDDIAYLGMYARLVTATRAPSPNRNSITDVAIQSLTEIRAIQADLSRYRA